MTTGEAGERTRTPNRWGEGQRLRQEILEAARRLLREADRPEEVTLRAIARETGIAAPSVYKHFKDKAELMWAVLDGVYAELADAMSAAARSAPDPWAALRAVVDAYWRFATEERRRYQLMFYIGPMLSGEHPFERHPTARVLRVWQEVVANYLADSDDTAGPVTGERAAPLLWTGLHGQLGVWWGTSHGDPQKPVLDLRDALLQALFGRC